MPKPKITLQELQRRNVIRAGVAYVVGGWLFLEVAAVLLPLLEAPAWLLRALIVGVVLGLPAVLALSWFFELTAAGLKRTEDVPAADSTGRLFDRRFDFVVIGILFGALIMSVYGRTAMTTKSILRWPSAGTARSAPSASTSIPRLVMS